MVWRPAALAAAVCLMPALALAQSWTVQPDDSALRFAVMQGSTKIDGAFETFSADITFDPDQLDQASVTVTVDISSFESGDATRDSTAMGAQWFAAGQFPEAVYATRSFEATGDGTYNVVADLTMRGVTKEVSHPVSITIDGDTAQAVGEVPIMRTEFGVGQGEFATGNTVALDVTVTFDIKATR